MEEHEIGGNKFLVEDRGTRIFLDFGMQMGKVNQYFAEFLQPRICNGMGDLFEFMMLPKLGGLYRRDYSKHMGFDGSEDTEFHGILLTHAHIDHGAYIHYLRPDIPLYCSEATKLIIQALQDTGIQKNTLLVNNISSFIKIRKEKYVGVEVKTIGSHVRFRFLKVRRNSLLTL